METMILLCFSGPWCFSAAALTPSCLSFWAYVVYFNFTLDKFLFKVIRTSLCILSAVFLLVLFVLFITCAFCYFTLCSFAFLFSVILVKDGLSLERGRVVLVKLGSHQWFVLALHLSCHDISFSHVQIIIMTPKSYFSSPSVQLPLMTWVRVYQTYCFSLYFIKTCFLEPQIHFNAFKSIGIFIYLGPI